jgi:penicillin G amidase
VRASQHGPIVNDILTSAPAAHSLALHIPLLSDQSASLEAVMSMMGAADWAAFRRAMEGLTGPPLNLIYGDVRGNIGYQAMARTLCAPP